MLPRVTVELQHTFPGCYSVMHDIKQAQRHGEQLLVQAEAAARAFAADAAERDDYLARLDRAWDDLLFTEFHDILTGTSIPAAWDSVRAMQGRARITGEEVLYDTTRRWSYRTLPRVNEHQIVVAEHRRPAAARLRRGRALSRFRRLGRPLDQRRGRQSRGVPGGAAGREPADPAHPVRGGDRRRDQPPVSGAGRSAAGARPGRHAMAASPDALSNGPVTVSLRDGGIGQIAFNGTELLGRGGIGLHLRKDTTDTWTFHTDRWEEPVEATLAGGAWQVEETGPLRVRARLDGRLGNSRIRLTVSLCRGSNTTEPGAAAAAATYCSHHAQAARHFRRALELRRISPRRG